MTIAALNIRHLGTCDYQKIWECMKTFNHTRTETTTDEIWLLQHHPVFTQGQAGKPEHILDPGKIPVIQTDRGGQVTYHGPGQLIAYVLLDIERLQIGIRKLVNTLENSVIALLAEYQIKAHTQYKAPGVYIDTAKICSVGLRVRKGRCYHGIALNVAMDMEPFSRINPCGYRGQRMTQLKDFLPEINLVEIEAKIVQHVGTHFGYNLTSVLGN